MRSWSRFREIRKEYPQPFWILFWGSLVNASGSSMVWPFLTIYLRQKLDVPLTTVALLLTINSIAGLIAMFIAGPIADRVGRKGVMLTSMFASSFVYIGMILASSLQAWVVLMIFNGALSPIFRVGSDSMIADLVEPARRPNAYALLRMIVNLGIAIGPAVGGFIASVSYAYAFSAAAATSMIYALLILLRVPETIPARDTSTSIEKASAPRGYGRIFRDTPFMAFTLFFTFASIGYIMLMVLLPVYGKENYGVRENQYGFILATNAALVVLFQYLVTNRTRRFPRLRMLFVGSVLYAIGVGSVALGRGFWGFLVSMIILTVGELIMMPTATALTADLAPADMRGRYMSIYSLTFGIGIGIGPVVGGYLNDTVSPRAIWYGGMLMCALAALGFYFLSRTTPEPSTSNTPVEVS